MRFKFGLFFIIMMFSGAAYAQQSLNSEAIEGVSDGYANHYLQEKKQDLKPLWKILDDLSDAEKKFIFDYRAAREDKDVEILNGLIHPESLACENEMRAPYFEGLREFYLAEELPESFDVKFIKVRDEMRWPLKEKLEFPKTPTHVLYIEYKKDGFVEGLQRYLRLEEEASGDKFYELAKCPSAESMEQMREAAQAELDK